MRLHGDPTVRVLLDKRQYFFLHAIPIEIQREWVLCLGVIASLETLSHVC